MAADTPLSQRAAITYTYERFRALSAGVLDTAGTTFLLLFAVRWYEAGPMAKALVASGGSLGLLLTPVVVTYVEASGASPAKAASTLALFGSLCFVLMLAVPVLPVFIIGSLLSMAASSAAIPLLTQIYQENYPARQRGRLLARTMVLRIGAAALFSQLGGTILNRELRYFYAVLLVFAAAFGVAAFCLHHYPSQPLARSGGKHPFRALRFAQTDKLFRRTLLCWMFMGLGNLMMLPLRVEYLANPKYGLMLDASAIALFTGVIPNVARLVLSPVWGYLFDHMNFFGLRVLLNLGFAAGILAFFTSHDLAGLLIGGLIYGVSNAGGDVAWSLWVTKFAPPGRVADYMSVHTFFTGVRGVAAPILAFHLAATVPLKVLGLICAGLILAGSALLIPEIPRGRKSAPAAVLVEEVSE